MLGAARGLIRRRLTSPSNGSEISDSVPPKSLEISDCALPEFSDGPKSDRSISDRAHSQIRQFLIEKSINVRFPMLPPAKCMHKTCMSELMCSLLLICVECLSSRAHFPRRCRFLRMSQLPCPFLRMSVTCLSSRAHFGCRRSSRAQREYVYVFLIVLVSRGRRWNASVGTSHWILSIAWRSCSSYSLIE